MRDKVEDFSDLKSELDVIIDKIQEDQSNFLLLDKPIVIKDNTYSYRLDNCISNWYYGQGKSFDYSKIDIYNDVKILKKNFANITSLMNFITVDKGFDFQLNKKMLCMLLGIPISQYQTYLSAPGEIGYMFNDIEEWLISTKMNSAETSTRNSKAINDTLSTKGKFGGHDVEKVKSVVSIESNEKNVIDFTNIEQAKKTIATKYSGLLGNKK